ncbi:MAG TPA: serine/threonine-protein kinase [Vicinamibacterales bacterium]|jgi:serine/threonine protein kinase|nr:serine/threonine-protein kinase [Vicinamibacterales bacterium]
MSGSPAPIGVVAHYNLLERLEPSGPGDLYRARDTKAGRTVAVRLLPADFTSDPATLISQARGLTSLSHPNVTTLFEVGEHEGRVYFAFEFQKGQSLRAEAAGRPMNVRRAIEIAIQIADAVSDAHAAGFVHGGLSPESIVISAKGRAKIPAFELAAQGGFEHDGREARLRDYESPEEANGQAPDDRSDIYSVGAILYEMLTTRRPMHRGASAPSASNPKVPKEIDAVVLKALAPNPASRYQSAIGLAGELRAAISVLDQLGIAGEEEELAQTSTTSIRRVVTMAAVLLVFAVLAWWFWLR